VQQTRHRITFLILGVALIVIVAGAIALAPDGRTTALPDAVDSYAPVDGATVLRQTQLVIDLGVGYAIDLMVDGVAIPDAELDIVPQTGLFTWTPGPGKTFEEWAPGFHAVAVTWDRATGLPDPGSLRWSFRVQ
jgi:hypothetical protein